MNLAFIIIPALLVIGVGLYWLYVSRVEFLEDIHRALVWKALSLALSNDVGDETDDAIIAYIQGTLDTFKNDMTILNKLTIMEFLFSDIEALISPEAKSAYNEYKLVLAGSSV